MKCASHNVAFGGPHGSGGSVYTCPACGLRIDMMAYPGAGAVTVVVHPPRNWLAQLFFDLARWLEG